MGLLSRIYLRGRFKRYKIRLVEVDSPYRDDKTPQVPVCLDKGRSVGLLRIASGSPTTAPAQPFVFSIYLQTSHNLLSFDDEVSDPVKRIIF